MAQLRDDAQAQGLRVAAYSARLVDVTRAIADRAGLGSGDPCLAGLGQRRGECRGDRALAQRDQGLRSPSVRLRHRRERLLEIAPGPAVVDLRAEARGTRAARPASRRAVAVVPNLDAFMPLAGAHYNLR